MSAQHAVIVAVVTMEKEKVLSGGAPIFIVDDEENLQKTAMTLEKVMDASTHEVNASTLILVAH